MSQTSVLSDRSTAYAAHWNDEQACELATVAQCDNQPPVAVLVGDVSDQGFRITTRENMAPGAVLGVDLAAGATDMGMVRVRVAQVKKLPDGLWHLKCEIIEDPEPDPGQTARTPAAYQEEDSTQF
jgi:hypothetical protein